MKMRRYPIVTITTIDHSANDSSGDSEEVPMFVTGILRKETKTSYYLTHWVFDWDLNDDHNVSGCVVKVKGLKKRTVGYVTLPECK